MIGLQLSEMLFEKNSVLLISQPTLWKLVPNNHYSILNFFKKFCGNLFAFMLYIYLHNILNFAPWHTKHKILTDWLVYRKKKKTATPFLEFQWQIWKLNHIFEYFTLYTRMINLSRIFISSTSQWCSNLELSGFSHFYCLLFHI